METQPRGIVEIVRFPGAPEVLLTRAKRAPLASLMTLAVTPAFWPLMAAAKPFERIIRIVHGDRHGGLASHRNLEASGADSGRGRGDGIGVIGRSGREGIDHDRMCPPRAVGSALAVSTVESEDVAVRELTAPLALLKSPTAVVRLLISSWMPCSAFVLVWSACLLSLQRRQRRFGSRQSHIE